MNQDFAIERLDSILASPEIAPDVVHVENLPPKVGSYVEIPEGVDERIKTVLRARGLARLYSHQAECRELVLSGKNLVVVTPTASGKTLCYNLPVVETLLKNPEARALYLFPTKALSQDQQAELNEIALGGGEEGSSVLPLKIVTYDGDTPNSLRISARESGRIVITNPDMLHSGILPNHPKWIRFFTNLKFIVIDEMHTYKGIFGSHVANVLRRLKRVAAFYGSRPSFILCSATIGNPKELAESILEEEVSLVDRNGAPSGGKRIVFCNPPLLDPVQGIRRSSATEAEKIALTCLKGGIKTILFARSRIRTEIIAAAINASLANIYTDYSRIKVEPYRSGYLPSERRAIEKGLRDGSVQGVVSTNALELGIDIGGLDASVITGFPGSFASFWQQAGRAGRRSSLSCAFYVASSSPLDQYIVRHPEYFFSRPPESARIDSDNPYVLSDHVKCAAFELPFSKGEAFGEDVEAVLASLEEEGTVRHTGEKWYWSDRSYPSESISLRSATADNIVIVDETRGKNTVIGEMDRPSAKELIFDDAVYIHRGRQYIVKKLDIENRICRVEEAEVNFYTDAVVKTDIKVLTEDGREEKPGWSWALGDVLVRTEATKYKKIRFHTHENIGFGEIFQGEEEMQTRSAVLLFPEGGRGGKFLKDLPPGLLPAVLSGLGHLVREIAPVFLSCEPRDLGTAERVRDPHFAVPALYVFDRYPGGTGLAEGLIPFLPRIFSACLESARRCSCVSGCPSCIGAIDAPISGKVREMMPGLGEGGGRSGNLRSEVGAFLAALLDEE